MGMIEASMCQTSQMARSISTGLMAQNIMGNGGTVNPMAEGSLCPCQVSDVATTTASFSSTTTENDFRSVTSSLHAMC